MPRSKSPRKPLSTLELLSGIPDSAWGKISVDDVGRYLDRHDTPWEHASTPRSGFRCWNHSSTETWVDVPTDPTFADYSLRMYDAIYDIAVAERRPLPAVCRSIRPMEPNDLAK